MSHISSYDAMYESVSNIIFREYKDVLTVNDLCRALGIGKNAAYTLLQENRIQYIKIGKKYYIPKLFLIDYVMQFRNCGKDLAI